MGTLTTVSFDPEQELARYRTQLEEVERSAEGLRQIIALLEDMATGRPFKVKLVSEGSTPAMITIPADRLREYRPKGGRRGSGPGGRSLKQVLRELYADGERRTVDDAVAQVIERGLFTEGSLPKRASFTNRLNDLTNEKYLRQVRRGVHELASPNGSAPSVDADGTDKAEPDGGQASFQEGEGLESGPAGGTDRPPAGSQAIGATAGAARRT